MPLYVLVRVWPFVCTKLPAKLFRWLSLRSSMPSSRFKKAWTAISFSWLAVPPTPRRLPRLVPRSLLRSAALSEIPSRVFKNALTLMSFSDAPSAT
jgi:hypothetical protein